MRKASEGTPDLRRMIHFMNIAAMAAITAVLEVNMVASNGFPIAKVIAVPIAHPIAQRINPFLVIIISTSFHHAISERFSPTF